MNDSRDIEDRVFESSFRDFAGIQRYNNNYYSCQSNYISQSHNTEFIAIQQFIINILTVKQEQNFEVFWAIQCEIANILMAIFAILSAQNIFAFEIISMQKYKIEEKIGEGSFGIVYLVKDQKNQRFALKKIHIDPFGVEQSLLEIEMMKKFTHPNLVKIFDFNLNQEIQQLQIVMEYCPNGDLSHYLSKKQKLDSEEVLEIFRQIVRAFILMTVKGVIHRDLKPENLLMGEGSLIKIADFGCAKFIGDMDMSKVDNFSLDKGTFLYASPEQLKNQQYSFKCDVWAAGCLVYLLYFGYHPFIDSKPHITLMNIKNATENKFISLDASTNPTIAKLIGLTLIYSDKQRASWRELWLSRIFSPKIKDIKKFVEYLKNLSSIASWVTKQFWKIRKEFHISKNTDEIFIYFIIKFQYTNLKMALKVLKKSDNYRYLFNDNSFKDYEPNEQQFNQVKKAYLEHEKYFLSIKKTMQLKQSFQQIAQRQPERGSCFSDLQKSIRACYRILSQIRVQIETHSKKDNKVWIAMGQWMNFQCWFSFQKFPILEKIQNETHNINAHIVEQLQKYESGKVE